MRISNRNPKEQVRWRSWYGWWRYASIDRCGYQTATPKNKSGGGPGMGGGDMQGTGSEMDTTTEAMVLVGKARIEWVFS